MTYGIGSETFETSGSSATKFTKFCLKKETQFDTVFTLIHEYNVRLRLSHYLVLRTFRGVATGQGLGDTSPN